jgi:hypothetical protein
MASEEAALLTVTNSGRDWRTMYSAYVIQLQAQKNDKK